MTFIPEVYPSTFSVLYCPHKGCCTEVPFSTPHNVLRHLNTVHGITIHNSDAIVPILDRYLESISENTEKKSFGQPDDTEDAKLRQKLQSDRLQNILDYQQYERTTNFKTPANCLFCLEGLSDKYELFAHMYKMHSFNIGQIDNLVMVEGFIQSLEAVIARHICIYCEKQFPDAATLKKHMRCKEHFKINSHNPQYDRYYIVNYMLPGTTWQELPVDLADLSLQSDSDDSWNDLDDPVDMKTICLFCEHQSSTPESTLEHMECKHGFRLSDLFNCFYDGIKVVNYLRVCWRDSQCGYCRRECCSSDDLAEHYQSSGCIQSQALSDKWQEPEFLFPFYEDDNLLSILD